METLNFKKLISYLVWFTTGAYLASKIFHFFEVGIYADYDNHWYIVEGSLFFLSSIYLNNIYKTESTNNI